MEPTPHPIIQIPSSDPHHPRACAREDDDDGPSGSRNRQVQIDRPTFDGGLAPDIRGRCREVAAGALPRVQRFWRTELRPLELERVIWQSVGDSFALASLNVQSLVDMVVAVIEDVISHAKDKPGTLAYFRRPLAERFAQEDELLLREGLEIREREAHRGQAREAERWLEANREEARAKVRGLIEQIANGPGPGGPAPPGALKIRRSGKTMHVYDLGETVQAQNQKGSR